MRPADFFIEPDSSSVEDDSFPGLFGGSKRRFNENLVDELRRLPLADKTDIEVAVPLARLVHDELQAFGTGGGGELSDDQMREVLQALRAVVRRLGIDDFEVPFRDFTSFRSWWIKSGASGSGGWQARRDLLSDIFDSLHDRLADMEQEALAALCAKPEGGPLSLMPIFDNGINQPRAWGEVLFDETRELNVPFLVHPGLSVYGRQEIGLFTPPIDMFGSSSLCGAIFRATHLMIHRLLGLLDAIEHDHTEVDDGELHLV